MEFKGTKGKWESVFIPESMYYTSRHEIHFGNDGECVAEFVHNKYDARLISKAPEMLEKLKQILAIINESDRVAGYHLNGSVAEWDSFEEIQDLEQLIKEATEL